MFAELPNLCKQNTFCVSLYHFRPGTYLAHKMRVAVVGAGISGLGAAYELAKAGVKVCLYEKEEKLGGHAKTVTVNGVNLDMGFMVFNRVSPFYFTTSNITLYIMHLFWMHERDAAI
ncbi:hypothetical protein V2J09_005623 [Rumex salicifolius]